MSRRERPSDAMMGPVTKKKTHEDPIIVNNIPDLIRIIRQVWKEPDSRAPSVPYGVLGGWDINEDEGDISDSVLLGLLEGSWFSRIDGFHENIGYLRHIQEKTINRGGNYPNLLLIAQIDQEQKLWAKRYVENPRDYPGWLEENRKPRPRLTWEYIEFAGWRSAIQEGLRFVINSKIKPSI